MVAAQQDTRPQAHITVRDLTMAYGDFVVMRDLNFDVNRGDVFIIMGGSGCGKSTLLKQMIGLRAPAKGDISYEGVSFWKSAEEMQNRLKRSFDVTFQQKTL